DVLSYLMPYYSYDQSQTCGPDSQVICKNYKALGDQNIALRAIP
ncbi:unnamed protein product, partial [Allacma fusca]